MRVFYIVRDNKGSNVLSVVYTNNHVFYSIYGSVVSIEHVSIGDILNINDKHSYATTYNTFLSTYNNDIVACVTGDNSVEILEYDTSSGFSLKYDHTEVGYDFYRSVSDTTNGYIFLYKHTPQSNPTNTYISAYSYNGLTLSILATIETTPYGMYFIGGYLYLTFLKNIKKYSFDGVSFTLEEEYTIVSAYDMYFTHLSSDGTYLYAGLIVPNDNISIDRLYAFDLNLNLIDSYGASTTGTAPLCRVIEGIRYVFYGLNASYNTIIFDGSSFIDSSRTISTGGTNVGDGDILVGDVFYSGIGSYIVKSIPSDVMPTSFGNVQWFNPSTLT